MAHLRDVPHIIQVCISAMSFWNLHHILLTWKCTWIARACMCVCVTNHSIKHVHDFYINMYANTFIYRYWNMYPNLSMYLVFFYFLNFKYIFYLHQNFNILFARQQFFAGLSTFLGSPNTAFFQHKCCHVHMLWNPPFWQLYSLFKGVPQHEKTPTIVYKGSSLQFPKVQSFLFYKYHTQEHHLFHKNSAVLSLHTLTQNPRISASFNHFVLHQNVNEFPQCVLPII